MSYPKLPSAPTNSELIEHFTLLPEENKLVDRIRSPQNRLGASVLLKSFQFLGYPPSERAEIPFRVVEHLASQLELEPRMFERYQWKGRAFRYHLSLVRQHTGFRPFQAKDRGKLARWVLGNGNEYPTRKKLLQAVISTFQRWKIELPAEKELRRLVNSARKQWMGRTFKKVNKLLSPETRALMAELVETSEDESSKLDWLKSSPGRTGMKTIKEEISKLQCHKELKKIKTNFVDLVLTDPPYGTTKCKWDSPLDFSVLWPELLRVTKENSPILLHSTQPFTSVLVNSNLSLFKYCWIWDKVKPNGHLVAKKRPLQRNEEICVFGDGRINYYPQMTDRTIEKRSKEYKRTEIMGGTKSGSDKILTKKYPQNIIVFSNANQRNKLHPTQKPIELLEYLLLTYSKEGDVVLDFTMGSGSTGVACKNINRNFIGIENDLYYFNIAKERINS